MPKKYFLFIFLLFLALGLSACGGNDAGIPGKDFTVTIIKPESAVYAACADITFEGEATDYYFDGEWHEVEITGSDLIWESSLDGPIGVGEEVIRSAGSLSSGEHIITLAAIGVNDITKSASVRITISSSDPNIDQIPPAEDQISSDILEQIEQDAAEKYPDDYQMQLFYKEIQVKSYIEIQDYDAPIPFDILAEIKAGAAEVWPGDYRMQLYHIETQVEAYIELYGT